MAIIRCRLQGQGFIEVLATLLIIAVSVLALIRFQTNLIYTNSLNQQQSMALSLALKQVETTRHFSALSGANSYQSITSGSSSATLTNTTYTITWTVTTSVNPDYKTISATVTWQDIRGVNQSINLETRVAGVEPAYSAAIMG